MWNRLKDWMRAERRPAAPRASKSYVMREGRPVVADSAFHAWTSGSLDAMLAALEVQTNLIDRHFLLMGIVNETYRRREEPEMAERCAQISKLHLAEFSQIATALKRDMGGVLPRVTTFQHYATLLTEIGDFEGAVEVCNQALGYGLHDGTKSGFLGRIERIQKKARRARQSEGDE